MFPERNKRHQKLLWQLQENGNHKVLNSQNNKQKAMRQHSWHICLQKRSGCNTFKTIQLSQMTFLRELTTVQSRTRGGKGEIMFWFSITKLPITPTETETLDTGTRRHPYSQQVLTAQSPNLTVRRVRQSRRERSADSSPDTSQSRNEQFLKYNSRYILKREAGSTHIIYILRSLQLVINIKPCLLILIIQLLFQT